MLNRTENLQNYSHMFCFFFQIICLLVRLMGVTLILQFFCHLSFDLLVALDQSEVGRIHPQGTMHVCMKFNGNASVWTTVMNRLTDIANMT